MLWFLCAGIPWLLLHAAVVSDVTDKLVGRALEYCHIDEPVSLKSLVGKHKDSLGGKAEHLLKTCVIKKSPKCLNVLLTEFPWLYHWTDKIVRYLIKSNELKLLRAWLDGPVQFKHKWLLQAIRYNRTQIVLWMLREGFVDPIEDRGPSYYLACALEQIDIIRILLTDDRLRPLSGPATIFKFFQNHPIMVLEVLAQPHIGALGVPIHGPPALYDVSMVVNQFRVPRYQKPSPEFAKTKEELNRFERCEKRLAASVLYLLTNEELSCIQAVKMDDCGTFKQWLNDSPSAYMLEWAWRACKGRIRKHLVRAFVGRRIESEMVVNNVESAWSYFKTVVLNKNTLQLVEADSPLLSGYVRFVRNLFLLYLHNRSTLEIPSELFLLIFNSCPYVQFKL